MKRQEGFMVCLLTRSERVSLINKHISIWVCTKLLESESFVLPLPNKIRKMEGNDTFLCIFPAYLGNKSVPRIAFA